MGLDPIVAAADFVGAVQTIVSRNSNPFAANLVSVTHIQAGNTWNVIPETAFVEGTARTMTKEDRQLVEARIRVLADHIAQAYGESASVEWIAGPPATLNEEEWTGFAASVAKESGINVVQAPWNLGGEDFAYFWKNPRVLYPGRHRRYLFESPSEIPGRSGLPVPDVGISGHPGEKGPGSAAEMRRGHDCLSRCQ